MFTVYLYIYFNCPAIGLNPRKWSRQWGQRKITSFLRDSNSSARDKHADSQGRNKMLRMHGAERWRRRRGMRRGQDGHPKRRRARVGDPREARRRERQGEPGGSGRSLQGAHRSGLVLGGWDSCPRGPGHTPRPLCLSVSSSLKGGESYLPGSWGCNDCQT